MKAAVVFDCHLWPHKRFGGPLKAGNNRRGQLTLQTLRAAVDGANAEDAPLIVAGDLVDEAGPIWPQFGAAIRAELGRTAKGVYLIPGNHDMTAADDHSLRLYEECSQQSWVRVVEDFFRLGDIDLVPFNCDFTDPRIEAPIVIGHFGVFDDDFPSFMKRAHGAWDVNKLSAHMKDRAIQIALLGDWHARFTWIDDGERLGKVLEQSGQSWAFNTRQPLLDMDWLEERRLWLFRRATAEAASICAFVDQPSRRIRYEDSATRSSLSKPGVRPTRTSGAGDSARELAAQQQSARDQRTQDSLQEWSSVRRGEHGVDQSYPSPMSYLHPNTSSQISQEAKTPQSCRAIMQGGALVPTGFDNKGLHGYGTLTIIDTDRGTLSWRELSGPRFCTAYEQLEEEQLIAEAKQHGHQLFLRRYFDSARPDQPAGVEAYEPLPIALRKKAQLVLGVDPLPTAGRLEALVTGWLDEMRAVHGEDAALHEKLLRRYL